MLDVSIELHFKPIRLDDGGFYDFCKDNDSLKFERAAKGNIFVMLNPGGKTGKTKISTTNS